MATIHLSPDDHCDSRAVRRRAHDFGPGRKELFPNSADGYLKVHDQGPDWADVTEGSNGIWERLRYDWCQPRAHHVDDTDSNTWGGRSGTLYPTPRPGGNHRRGRRRGPRGKNLKGGCSGSWRRPAASGSWQGAGQHHQGHRDQELPDNGGELLTWLHGPGVRRRARARHDRSGFRFSLEISAANTLCGISTIMDGSRGRRDTRRTGRPDPASRRRTEQPGRRAETAPGARACPATPAPRTSAFSVSWLGVISRG